MKNSKRNLVLSSVILAFGLSLPSVSFSEEATTETTSSSSASSAGVVEAINTLRASNEADLAAIRAEAGSFTRQDVASAIINYEAEARLKAYELNQELLFMHAPGVQWAIETGKMVGEANADDRAQELVNGAFQELMSKYWPTDEQIAAQNLSDAIEGSGGLVASTPPKSPRQIMYEQFIEGKVGSDGDVMPLNMGEVLRLNKTTPELAKQLMTIIIGADQEIDTDTVKKLKETQGMTADEIASGGLDGLQPKEKEQAAGAMIDAVNIAPSTNILSAMLSRRILAADDTNPDSKTVMELIEKYATDRFQNGAWYGEIGKSSDTALLREITHIMAYNSWMQLQTFKLQEQQAAAIAIMNANASRLYNVMKEFADSYLDEENQDAIRKQIEASKDYEDILKETKDSSSDE